MKNKFGVDLCVTEKFVGDLPVNEKGQRSGGKISFRRESVTPKIVVCPPMEDISEQMNAPRGGRLLKALGGLLSRRGTDADSLGSGSSSSESDSCDGARGDDRSSCFASDSNSDGSERRGRHRSTVSLRRVFQSLNITVRSQSSSPDSQRQPKKQQQPKRILRPPVTYTYARGLSGLPTQRVPRHNICCTSLGR